MSRTVQISPSHRVALSDDYLGMIDVAPREDFVVRTLARRKAGDMTLMMGELVIAGAATRDAFELARAYPLHFRKTYFPGKMHGDPREELELHQHAARLLDIPPPIGATRNTFRSCFLPGTPFDRLSSLGSEPDESNIAAVRALPFATVAGLWRLAEELFGALERMHQGGLAHGDAHLHNFIVCPSPLAVLPIDFERAALRDAVSSEQWLERCEADVRHVLKFGVILQCALGVGHSPLAQQSMRRIESLVHPAKTFRRAIEERSFDAAPFE